MRSWSGGYVADIEYIEGFYPQQSPPRMVLGCLLGGVAADLPAADDVVHYLELGCGRGMGALMIAASNPAWRVTAIDYNPTHIAMGTAIARAAGIGNVDFMEADLVTLAGSDAARAIPQADFVSLHGVWTWVGPEVRAGIVRLLGQIVRPGGVVHVSYNALPAWQGALGMQRLVYEGGRRGATRSDRQASAGLELAREVNAAGAHYLTESGLVRELLERTAGLMPEYLSHEYMNAHWAPAFQADVAAAMADAKLDWVASANPLENFPQLMLTDEQRVLFERFDDPIMRELVKDVCLPRQFRHDLYVRGPRRIPNAERDAAVAALVLAPTVSAAELETAIDVPAGKAEMSADLKAMMAALMPGPASVAQLLTQAPGRSSPAELAGVLVGSLQGQILPHPGAEQPACATRLNRVLGGRVQSLAGTANMGALASGPLGTGLPVPKLVQFIAGRLLAGEDESAAGSWVDSLAADIVPEKRETVATMVQSAIEKRVPILRRLGIVPG